MEENYNLDQLNGLNEYARKMAEKLVELGATVVVLANPVSNILNEKLTWFHFSDGEAIYYFQVDEKGRFCLDRVHMPSNTEGTQYGVLDGYLVDIDELAKQAMEILETRRVSFVCQAGLRKHYKNLDHFLKELWFKDNAIVVKK